MRHLILFVALWTPFLRAEEWKALPSIPEKMEIAKDEEGFNWQLTKDGSIFGSITNVAECATQRFFRIGSISRAR